MMPRAEGSRHRREDGISGAVLAEGAAGRPRRGGVRLPPRQDYRRGPAPPEQPAGPRPQGGSRRAPRPRCAAPLQHHSAARGRRGAPRG